MLTWIRRRFWIGLALVAVGLILVGGWALGSVTAHVGPTRTIAGATLTHTSVEQKTITVKIRGRVLRRVDHVLVVQTPRYVFIYRGRRHVIPPHIVRIRYRQAPQQGPPAVGAVVGVAPTPVTVTVPVTVPVSGPETTVIRTVIQTEPPTTITTTDTTTVTVTIPALSGGDSARRTR